MDAQFLVQAIGRGPRVDTDAALSVECFDGTSALAMILIWLWSVWLSGLMGASISVHPSTYWA